MDEKLEDQLSEKPEEKTVLCYGDSNTWGYMPITASRLPRLQRWPSILGSLLGDSCHVIAEGLNGRSTAWDEPFRGGRNARSSLMAALESHAPLSLVVLMLGTNDMKHHLNVSAVESSRGISALVQIIQKSEMGHAGTAPLILVVAPPRLAKLSERMTQHFDGSIERSSELPRWYRQVCEDLKCHFFDSNAVVEVGADGVHLDADGHRTLAQVLAPVVRSLVAPAD